MMESQDEQQDQFVNLDIKGFRRLLWPFGEDEIQRILQKIERSKSNFNLALHLYQSFEPFMY